MHALAIAHVWHTCSLVHKTIYIPCVYRVKMNAACTRLSAQSHMYVQAVPMYTVSFPCMQFDLATYEYTFLHVIMSSQKQ